MTQISSERQTLHFFSEDERLPARIRRRFEMLLLLDAGESPSAVARALKTRRDIVEGVAAKFEQGGFPAVLALRASGDAEAHEEEDYSEKDRPMKGASRLTLSDIAVATGFSTATVSDALREKKKVAAKTRETIKRVAAQLGYRADPLLSSLARRRWSPHSDYRETLAVLYPGNDHKGVFARILYRQASLVGMETRAGELGYQLKFIDIHTAKRNLNNVLINSGIRGVILSNIDPTRTGEPALDYNRFAFVACGYAVCYKQFHCVVPDLTESVQLTILKVQERFPGERVGMILYGHNAPSWIMENMLAAAYKAVDLKRLSWCPEPIFSVHKGYDLRELKAWMKRNRPRVLIVQNDGGYWSMQEIGFRVPEDVFLTTLIKVPRDDFIAGYRPLYDQVGRRTIDLMHNLLAEGSIGYPEQIERTLITSEWNEGSTFSPSLAAETRQAAAQST